MLSLIIAALKTVLSAKFATGVVVGAVIGGPALLKVWQTVYTWAKARVH